jgi:phosphoglycolate phosphatase-like HAD superfamily hydrolase
MEKLESTVLPAPFVWNGFAAYLFDIDGTLVNSRDGVHYNAFFRAFRETWKRELKLDGIPLHGNTDIGILRAAALVAGVSVAEFSGKLPQALAMMQAEVEVNAAQLRAELCPSIRELLERLHSAGKLLGVTSGNLEPIGWAKLRAAGIAGYFRFGAFSAAPDFTAGTHNETRVAIFQQGIGEVRHRLGESAAVCFIGDTPADVRAARAVSASVIAVATGINDVETLRRERPDLCLSCCTELLEPHRP